MKLGLPLLLSALGVAVMAAFSAFAWVTLPADTRMIVHWGLDGQPDRWASKETALIIAPLTGIGVTVLFAVLSRVDPRGDHLMRSAGVFLAGWIGAILVLTYIHGAVVLTALGSSFPFLDYLILFIAGLIVVIGNVLGKTRSNFFAGIRTPWSLSSEASWEKTHRWSGRLFVAVGLLAIVVWFVLPAPWPMWVLFAGVIAASLAGVVLSYVFWRRDPDRQTF